jgi:hypothetical protein
MVAERETVVRRHRVVADPGLLETERLAREARFEVRREAELRRLVLDMLEVDDRVSGHALILPRPRTG